MRKQVLISVLTIAMLPLAAQQRIIVAADGSGDFKTVQGALNSLPAEASSPRTIYIRKGIYREKIYIEIPQVILEGENREKTILQAAIARDEWRCSHQDDWGVATINVGADDIALKNLTVSNTYAMENPDERTVNCPLDTAGGKRVIRADGHQMALRTLNVTRLKAVNCHFISRGGDTVSPWEVKKGQWYFKDCIMEGGVDLYCPRGWAWAENCHFIAHGGTAAIWHDGSAVADAKTVLKNCRFSGYDNFLLGRYHRDAQFYLVGCVFAANMRDSAIYRVSNPAAFNWGHRVYYTGCHREGGKDFSWYRDNLPAGLKATDITVKWVFGKSWNPEEN